jgi:two-component sensor histidine kinase
MKRKRGAQPGNSNALKHGFYAANFSVKERRRLSTAAQGQLKDEANLLRIMLDRAAASIQNQPAESLGFHDLLSALRAISMAIGRLESLHRTQNRIYSPQSLIEQALDEALLNFDPYYTDEDNQPDLIRITDPAFSRCAKPEDASETRPIQKQPPG